jgi:hypothetical protein
MDAKIYYFNGELLNSDVQEIPEGAKPVSDERYREIIAGFQAGCRLGEDDNGDPVAVPPPPPTPEELEARRKADIIGRLAEMDTLSIRPLRAIADNTATDFDREKLAALEAEAAELRAELKTMEKN